MIDPPLERLKQSLHGLDDGLVPPGRVRAEDVRAVVAEARRLSERVSVLERSLAVEVGMRDAARKTLEQTSLRWPKDVLGELLSSYSRR